MTLASLLEATGLSAVPVLLFIKATCLLLGALGISYVMMRASSGARHIVWLVVLSALLVLPIIAIWSPLRLEVLPAAFSSTRSADAAPQAVNRANPIVSTSIDGAPVASAPSGGVVGGVQTTQHESTADAASTEQASALSSVTAFVQRSTATVGGTLLVLWAVVSAALLGWLAFGAYSVRRIVRRAKPLENAEWQTPLYEIADRFQLADAPRLVRSEDVKMPFACGVFQSTIVLPAESDDWSADRRSAVLLHELGHVQRRDLIGHTLGRVACALYWFHPLVWTAARRLRAESERACDDLALSCGAKPSDYAEHLLDIVTCVRNHATPSIALAMAHRKEFEGRMLAILNPELERKRPSKRQSLALVGSLVMLFTAVGAAAPVADARVASTAPSEAQNNVNVADASMRMSSAMPHAQPAPNAAPAPAEQPNPTPQPNVSSQRGSSTSLDSVISAGINAARLGNQSGTNDAVNALARDGAKFGIAVADQFLKQGVAALGMAPPLASIPGATKASADERPALLAKVLRTDASDELRRIAAWGLHEYGDEAVAVDALIAAMDRDANVSVREMSAWSLGDVDHTDRVTTALINATHDRDDKVRATALWSLGNGADEKSLPAMEAALSSGDERVRELAIWGIGNISPKHVPKGVLTALSDKQPSVRKLAAWAVFNVQDEDALPALEAQMRRETDTDVQECLVRALASTGEKSVDALKTMIESKDERLRASAIKALAGVSGISAWPWPWPQPRPFP